MKSLIITESLFSQHGDIARVDLLKNVAKKYNSTLIVDDAHGLGTIGETGRGILEYYALAPNDITIITGAMNKALGAYGGYIISTKANIELIKNKAYELIFTSSVPALIMAAALTALNEISDNQEHVAKLKSNVLYFRDQLRKMGITLPKDITPIVPIVFGSMEKTCKVSSYLKKKGIIAIPIIPPAVSMDACRIRFQITSEHTKEDIDRLLGALTKVI